MNAKMTTAEEMAKIRLEFGKRRKEERRAHTASTNTPIHASKVGVNAFPTQS